ncbi:hypothetical protein QL285_022055 [Trifolium repens]|nr:hypothetical protein QL285_022055 [Trifolium repens]
MRIDHKTTMLIYHIASHQANTHIQANNYTCINNTRYFEVYVIVRKCPYLGKRSNTYNLLYASKTVSLDGVSNPANPLNLFQHITYLS